MNETPVLVRLRDHMDRDDAWGREEGRVVSQRLVAMVEKNPGALVFRISLDGVKRLDISFASETVVELAHRYRRKKAFCLVDVDSQDMLENWDAAAQRKEQPLIVWRGDDYQVIGIEPKRGAIDAFSYAMQRAVARASEYKDARQEQNMTINNASMKFKQLWQQGFLLRRESVSESGGVEFTYQRIK
jgi:uncharacterized protein with PIN domain